MEKKLSVSNPSIWFSAFVIIASLALILNTATIITFIVNRNLRRRSFYSLINLAIADIAQGILRFLQSLCAFGYSTVAVNCSMRTIDLVLSFIWLAAFASILALVLIALERVHAVIYPFKHQALSTRTYAASFVASWLLSLFAALLSQLLTGTSRELFTITGYFVGLLLALIIVISYSAVLVKVRKQNKQMQQRQQQSTIRQKREAKLAKTLFIVTGLCLVCWVPFIVNHLLHHISITHEINPNVFYGSLLAQFSNSFLNPIVYVLRLKEFRDSFIKLACKTPCNCTCGHRIEARRR